MSSDQFVLKLNELAGEFGRFQRRMAQAASINAHIAQFNASPAPAPAPVVHAPAAAAPDARAGAAAAPLDAQGASDSEEASTTLGAKGSASPRAGAATAAAGKQVGAGAAGSRRGGRTGIPAPRVRVNKAAPVAGGLRKAWLSKLATKLQQREHVDRLEFLLRALQARGEEGAVLSDLVKLSDCTVLQCNEYLNALMKLGDVLRRKHRNGLRYYINPKSAALR